MNPLISHEVLRHCALSLQFGLLSGIVAPAGMGGLCSEKGMAAKPMDTTDDEREYHFGLVDLSNRTREQKMPTGAVEVER